jgi:hypothetical protein
VSSDSSINVEERKWARCREEQEVPALTSFELKDPSLRPAEELVIRFSDVW